jgi:hypothetical protein
MLDSPAFCHEDHVFSDLCGEFGNAFEALWYAEEMEGPVEGLRERLAGGRQGF